MATITGNGNTYTAQKNITRIGNPPYMMTDVPSGTCIQPYNTRTFNAVASGDGTLDNVKKVEWQVIDYYNNQPISYTAQNSNGIENASIRFTMPSHYQDYVIGIVQRAMNTCGVYREEWGPGNYYMIRNNCSGTGYQAFSLSPNPTKDQITISTTSDYKAVKALQATVDKLNGISNKNYVMTNEKTVEVYDQRGIIVLKSSFSTDSHQLNVSKLPFGWYIIKIKDGKQTYEQKFIKK